jgi:hypothetical protein
VDVAKRVDAVLQRHAGLVLASQLCCRKTAC